jgi:hypothetical protein
VDWKRRFPSMAPKITRPNTTGLFPWGYVKNIVYQEKIADLRALRHRITEAVATVTEVMLVNTWREIEYRFDVCRATNGARTETYYETKNTLRFVLLDCEITSCV